MQLNMGPCMGTGCHRTWLGHVVRGIIIGGSLSEPHIEWFGIARNIWYDRHVCNVRCLALYYRHKHKIFYCACTSRSQTHSNLLICNLITLVHYKDRQRPGYDQLTRPRMTLLLLCIRYCHGMLSRQSSDIVQCVTSWLSTLY